MAKGATGVALGAFCLLLGTFGPSRAETYRISFSKSSSRMTWTPSIPSWSYSVPVAFSAAGDSTSMLRLSLSASLGTKLDQRDGNNIWSDNASIRSSINYPILGPKASIGINANMASRTVGLQRQKNRSQTFGFNFQYKPLQKGRFRSISVSVTPGLITAQRASRAKLDSLIEEKGIQYNASFRVSPDLKIKGKKLNMSFSTAKSDNTLKSDKKSNESLNSNLSYTWPHDITTRVSFSESRSQTGLTRGKVTETQVEDMVVRDTTVVAELSESRNTRVGTNIKFKLVGFDVDGGVDYSQSQRTNTASGDDDPRNAFFAKDNQIDNWGFKFKLSGKIKTGLNGSAALNYGLRKNRRLPVVLQGGETFRDASDDRQDRDLSLNGRFNWTLNDDHSIGVSGQMRSIRDDNFGAPTQDRDTFSSSGGITYRGKFDNGLNVDVGLNANYSHRVNLDESRSSENSRNKDLRLNMGTRYERLGATFSHSFDISARRTIFDFDRLLNPELRDRRSNIRRGWNMRHTVRRSLLGKLSSNTTYSYKADDFGKLVTENGAQLVEEDNTGHSVSVGFNYNPSKVLTLGTTYSYRLDRQWLYRYLSSGTDRYQNLNRRNKHNSLRLNAVYRPGEGSEVSSTLSRSKQRSGTFTTFNIKMSRTF